MPADNSKGLVTTLSITGIMSTHRGRRTIGKIDKPQQGEPFDPNRQSSSARPAIPTNLSKANLC
jgi:hypothetical protein